MLEITITVDTNDGDYAYAMNVISKKDLDKLRPLIKAIKGFKPYKGKNYKNYLCTHNWTTGDCYRDDLGEKEPAEIYDFPEEIMELFEEFLPCPEYGFHTIERIEVCPKQDKERLL